MCTKFKKLSQTTLLTTPTIGKIDCCPSYGSNILPNGYNTSIRTCLP